MPVVGLSSNAASRGIRGVLYTLQINVVCQRTTIEEGLMEAFERTLPATAGARRFKLLKACDRIPSPGKLDLVKMACSSDQFMLEFNPFLSKSAIQSVRQGVLLWLQWCVLEDKLTRLCNYEEMGQEEEFVRELQVVREWSVNEHPQWLVFEVQHQLQIRPVQYQCARYLIQHPGAIIQLNMGEGKTRIILPMLLLSKLSQSKILRFNFLTQLLYEAFDYMHLRLTATVLRRAREVNRRDLPSRPPSDCARQT